MKLPFAVVLFLTASFLAGQQQPAQSDSQKTQQQDKDKKAAPPPMTPAARLAAAKTAYIKKSGGSDSIAFDVVNDTLQGWGRFTLVDAPEKADIIIEVFTTEDKPTGVSTSMKPSYRTGAPESSSSTSKEITISQIKLTVYDAKSKIGLWTGSEHPRGAMKKIARENNEVEAAQHLVERFHDDVEPPAKQ